MLKKTIFTLSILSLTPLAFAYASQLNDIIINLTGTMKFILILVMTMALVVFVWGIVKLIAAAGNPQEITKAKGIITWGIIGLAVMASLLGIIEIIQIYFGISPADITIPQF